MSGVTLDDIAVQLGLSKSTVSRALAGNPSIPPATRDRVRSAAARLNYHPNAIARALAGRRSRTIGLVLPRRADFVFQNPYFSELILGIGRTAEERGYPLLLGTAPADLAPYGVWLRERRIDGVIALGGGLSDDAARQLEELTAEGYPVVVVHPPRREIRAIIIEIDDAGGVRKAVTELARLGHRAVAFITGPQATRYAAERLRGYRQAVTKLGLAEHTGLVQAGDDTEVSGRLATDALLDSGETFTAIVANNDLIAIGALAALSQRGIRVPRDVSVIGFDDSPVAARSSPPLTTVRQPITEIGASAVLELLDAVEDPAARAPRRIRLRTRLLRRGSAGAAPGRRRSPERRRS